MPYRIKTQNKSPLLEPEALIDRYEQIGDWAMDHLKAIAIVVGLLITLGVAWGVISWMNQRSEEQAAILYADAFKSYQTSLDPTRQQRILAPETKTAYEQAIAGFEKVRAEYPRTTHAAIALFHQGNAYAALERYEEAISTYQLWLKDYAMADLVPLVTQRLAYAYWSKGEVSEALNSFDRIIRIAGAPNRDQALFETGRIQEQQGQKDKALETYNTLTTEYPSSPWGSEATARITALGGTPPNREADKAPSAAESSSVPATPSQ